MKYDDLIQHPEGGRYLEVYRSTTSVAKANATRTALTHIYFSLDPHEVSRFHRVSNDEVWNLYQGQGLYLYQWDGNAGSFDVIELSVQSMNFCHIIPAGYWQAAVPIQDRVLVGCSVAPGFEFEDFELIEPDSEVAKQLLAMDVSLSKLI
ncbi:MAG: cupin domain-containing protein [Leptolyngbyaceae cyanobacterium MAG.088]|nr:cupin domain-containing protein [Leptolyngbyaceae cyanobacterium MAG.088]